MAHLNVSMSLSMFDDLSIPVLICSFEDAFPVRYMNSKAALLLAPSFSVDAIGGIGQPQMLSSLLRFASDSGFASFERAAASGRVDSYNASIMAFDGQKLAVSISSVRYQGDEGEEYLALYIIANELNEQVMFASYISSIVNTLLVENEVDSSIQAMLAFAGGQTGVSRVYVFEEVSPTTTRNTYEWCAKGVEPAIQDLTDLKKADYNYDVIVDSGMYITDDVSTLPDNDRQILQAQGIKALAIITIYENGKPVGYVGFDDCRRERSWSYHEIQFLKSISALLALFIKRRNDEQIKANSLNILQIISDNSDEIIYANDLKDYRLLFVSKSLTERLNKSFSELIGQPCYKALRGGLDAPCEFCPIPKIQWSPGEKRSKLYTWEYHNPISNKTYIAKDNIVEWVDGSYAHIETAIDITRRMEQESKLKYYASTDVMTGIRNRESGSKRLIELYEANAGGSLCFIDLDGLKYTNDSFGHTAGDALIIGVVQALKQALAPDEIICRWGGDEFLLWLKSDEKETGLRMNSVQNKLHTRNELKQTPYVFSFSYGVVPFVNDNDGNFDALVTAADQQMYENKLQKRGRLLRRRKTDDPKGYA